MQLSASRNVHHETGASSAMLITKLILPVHPELCPVSEADFILFIKLLSHEKTSILTALMLNGCH